jgi:flagellin
MAQAAASSVNKEMEISMERLSTGKRINSAADDAAGVAIASRLSSEIRGTNQAIRNAMDGQALIDTAEGAHIEIENILQRMRELAVQASNGTNDANDRTNLQLEIDQLTTEIDRIATTTSWAGQKLMDGTGSFSFQVGSQTTASDLISTSLNAMSSSGIGVGLGNAATAITGISGTDGTGATITVQSKTVSASVAYNGTTFSTGVNSVSGGMESGSASSAALTYQIIDNKLIIDASAIVTDVANVAVGDKIGLTINGVKVTQAVATADAAGIEATVDALLDQIVADNTNFNWAKGAVADATAVTTDTDDGLVQLTIDDEDLAADLAAQLNAHAPFSSRFSAAASSTTGAITVSAVAAKPTITEADGNLSLNDNVLTVDTEDETDYSFVLEGQTVTITKADDDGYAVSTTGVAQKIIDKVTELGINVNMTLGTGTITFTKGGSLNLSTTANAQSAIDSIDAAIQTVNSQRATLGAVSNRLDSTVSNLTNISSNLQAGRGRIEDADFAAETTNLAKTQILQQASTAMLAQANAAKQNVLSLLQG